VRSLKKIKTRVLETRKNMQPNFSGSRYKSKGLIVPDNIFLLHIPPYTPEMDPIEQIWKQLRSMGFRNEVFENLNQVVDRLCDTIC